VPRAQPLERTQEILKTAQVEARSRIQVGKLIQRAAAIAAGEIVADPALLGVQMRATEMLLRKALPDLSSIEMSGPEGGPLTITIKKVA
jgi:hypothetical protein